MEGLTSGKNSTCIWIGMFWLLNYLYVRECRNFSYHSIIIMFMHAFVVHNNYMEIYDSMTIATLLFINHQLYGISHLTLSPVTNEIISNIILSKIQNFRG